jgi:hypothetical protein
MKQVKCKSGLTGSQEKLQKRYEDFTDFKNWSRTYNIHGRLGFKSMKSAWESNPTIQSSVQPSDLSVVYFHVIKGKNGLRIKESVEHSCKKVGSTSCFSNREGALAQLNNTELN